MTGRYILDGKTPVRCDDLLTWARWFENAERRVAADQIGPLRISTVFLGIDHRFPGHGPPLLFQTIMFDGGDDAYQVRTSTWEAAEAAHAEALAVARARLAEAEAAIGKVLP